MESIISRLPLPMELPSKKMKKIEKKIVIDFLIDRKDFRRFLIIFSFISFIMTFLIIFDLSFDFITTCISLHIINFIITSILFIVIDFIITSILLFNIILIIAFLLFIIYFSESVADVLVRANQLVSTIESMYSGENVLIISPDSDNLSVLQAALSDEDPDASLPKHSRFSFKNGEMRELLTVVKPTELLVTGQTQDEADIMYRKMKALRVGGNRAYLGSASTESWVDLWHLSIDNSRARS